MFKTKISERLSINLMLAIETAFTAMMCVAVVCWGDTFLARLIGMILLVPMIVSLTMSVIAADQSQDCEADCD